MLQNCVGRGTGAAPSDCPTIPPVAAGGPDGTAPAQSRRRSPYRFAVVVGEVAPPSETQAAALAWPSRLMNT